MLLLVGVHPQVLTTLPQRYHRWHTEVVQHMVRVIHLLILRSP